MPKLFFCERWFRGQNIPKGEMEHAQAKMRHLQGEPYTVLVGSAAKPTLFLEVAKDSVLACFMDELLRNHLSYGFVRPTNSKAMTPLFLNAVTKREFRGNTDEVARGELYFFSESGDVDVEKFVIDPPQTQIGHGKFEPKHHYEKFPAFGCYKEYIKLERGESFVALN